MSVESIEIPSMRATGAENVDEFAIWVEEQAREALARPGVTEVRVTYPDGTFDILTLGETGALVTVPAEFPTPEMTPIPDPEFNPLPEPERDLPEGVVRQDPEEPETVNRPDEEDQP